MKKLEILIILGIIFIITSLGLFGTYEKLEFRTYDLLLKIKPAVQEQPDLLIAAIDDASIGEVGTFPWSRDILANALIRMRELGAKTAVFDIEYVSRSQQGIDPDVAHSIPDKFAESEANIVSLLQDLSNAVADGSLPAEYIPETLNDLGNNYIQPEFSNLGQSLTSRLTRDNDKYFAQAIHFFGNVWLTINAGDIGIQISDELKQYVRDTMLLKDVSEPKGLTSKENNLFLAKQKLTRKMTPALLVLMQQTRGGGFTNVVLDSDGTRRRIELLHETDGLYIPQLVFGPILSMLDTKTLVRKKSSLTIKNALFPNETTRRDVTIPLDSHGRMLINWTKTPFAAAFKNESVLFLLDLDQKEKTIADLLKTFSDFEIGKDGKFLSYYDVARYLYQNYKDLEIMKNQLLSDTLVSYEDSRYQEYFSRRADFFTECKELMAANYEDEILTVLAESSNDETKQQIEEIAFFVSDKFTKYRNYLTEYTNLFKELHSLYNDAFCIIGHTASNSTDLGTTPFEGQYPNIGTHANIYNTIMNKNFIYPLPWYYPTGIIALFVLLLTFLQSKARALWINLTGILTILFVPALTILLMQWNIYAPIIMPLFIAIFSYIGLSLYRFATAEKDKAFLRRAFSTYLSEDVVNEIVNDPDKLSLGGEEKNLTALFTDIKSFSTLSEKVTPAQLVNILNDYLTDLSNIVLEQEGTIDKYIGDAIVAFFGAPIPTKDHAWKACVTAIRMKQAENKLNARLTEQGLLPMPLLTRIGINTGKMVVGNMGTDMKMNYTIMGNDVNLAARLEGVNKKYESWILVSDSTWNAANSGENANKLVARRLDQVRVVGINQPVQLFNIIGLREELSSEQLDCVDTFHRGLDAYLAKNFVEAKTFFEKALKILPSDGPSSVFSNRCNEFIQKGVSSSWDGVLTMTTK